MGEDAADQGTGQPGNTLAQFTFGEDFGLQPDGGGAGLPAVEVVHLGFCGGDVDVAFLRPSERLAEFGFEPLPELAGMDAEGEFLEVAAVLAHPAPVAARLFVRDGTLFQQHNGLPAFREVVGGGRADDAGADDDDIGRSGERWVIGHLRLLWEGHCSEHKAASTLKSQARPHAVSLY